MVRGNHYGKKSGLYYGILLDFEGHPRGEDADENTTVKIPVKRYYKMGPFVIRVKELS